MALALRTCEASCGFLVCVTLAMHDERNSWDLILDSSRGTVRSAASCFVTDLARWRRRAVDTCQLLLRVGRRSCRTFGDDHNTFGRSQLSGCCNREDQQVWRGCVGAVLGGNVIPNNRKHKQAMWQRPRLSQLDKRLSATCYTDMTDSPIAPYCAYRTLACTKSMRAANAWMGKSLLGLCPPAVRLRLTCMQWYVAPACVGAQRQRMLDGEWRKARSGSRRGCQQQVRRQRTGALQLA